MTVAGWIIMIVAISSVTLFFGYCLFMTFVRKH